ncbi:hypothetical protein JT723_08140 [Streptomyces bryophytorum]|uniref:hypothetical protein n=1 Tax=Actinacidiphila bryophytorum TaxID=1436133 RepID=UPI00195F88FB|nr:hypothetical protein [Actinacidiphila bryophytorum]MBM9435812.1 hypothetical protein [Actinacidiphila bryophytorum]MBN6547510.1 hypothetical protein [Actinacidiphila bryophytorum]
MLVVIPVRQVVPPAVPVGGTHELLEQGTAQEGAQDSLPVVRRDGHIADRRKQQGVAVHGVIDAGQEGVHSVRLRTRRRCREVRAIHDHSLRPARRGLNAFPYARVDRLFAALPRLALPQALLRSRGRNAGCDEAGRDEAGRDIISPGILCSDHLKTCSG